MHIVFSLRVCGRGGGVAGSLSAVRNLLAYVAPASFELGGVELSS